MNIICEILTNYTDVTFIQSELIENIREELYYSNSHPLIKRNDHLKQNFKYESNQHDKSIAQLCARNRT